MSWDIVLFNLATPVESVEMIDDDQLEPVDFAGMIKKAFKHHVVIDDAIEIKGDDFSIDFFDSPPSAHFMLSLSGENALYAIIELAKEHGWQIFDTGIGELIDLQKPEKNGYQNHINYVKKILNG